VPVDPKLVDLGIDQRVIADKHVDLGQHVEVTFAPSRYDHRRGIIPENHADIVELTESSSHFHFKNNRVSESNRNSSAGQSPLWG